MPLKSTPSTYGNVAVSIHWLTVILIIALLASGFRAAGTIDPAAKAALLRIHAPMGGAILLLTLTRLVWWWRFDKKPAPVEGGPAWQERIARYVHILLYIVVLGIAVSGVSMFVVSGAGPIVFGGTGILPDFTDFPPRTPHGLGARALLALAALHAGAALYHHFIKRDVTLKRMWF